MRTISKRIRLTYPHGDTILPPMKRPEVKIRFETQAQKDRIARAAKLRKWSFNQFVVDSADQVAAKTLTTSKAEQITEPDPLQA